MKKITPLVLALLLSACDMSSGVAKHQNVSSSEPNQPLITAMPTDPIFDKLTDEPIPISKGKLAEIHKTFLSAKEINVNTIKKLLAEIPITDNMKAYIEKEGAIPKQLVGDEKEIAEKLFAYQFYLQQVGISEAVDVLYSEKINQINNLKEDIDLINNSVLSKQNVAKTENEKKVLNKILERVEIRPLTIHQVQEHNNSGLFIVHLNNNPIPVVTNQNADYYIFQSSDAKRFKLHQLLNAKGEIVLFNTPQEREIYKDFISHLKPQIKHVFGKGERKMYVFSDPDCQYCREQDNDIQTFFTDKDNVTVYQVLNPIIQNHPHAAKKANHLLCVEDPSSEWLKMQKNDGKVEKFSPEGYDPSAYPKNADLNQCYKTLINENLWFATALGLHTTPITIMDNGVIVINRQSVDVLRKALKGESPKIANVDKN